MTELREELAKRLASFTVQRWQDERAAKGLQRESQPYYSLDKMVESYLPHADECIRQIAWNMTEICHRDRAAEGFENRDDAQQDAKDFGITLAPKDWKP